MAVQTGTIGLQAGEQVSSVLGSVFLCASITCLVLSTIASFWVVAKVNAQDNKPLIPLLMGGMKYSLAGAGFALFCIAVGWV